MSNGLSRLIAQAQGAVEGGLRPRPRTRFEDGASSGEVLTETQSEHPAQNAPAQPEQTVPQRMVAPPDSVMTEHPAASEPVTPQRHPEESFERQPVLRPRRLLETDDTAEQGQEPAQTENMRPQDAPLRAPLQSQTSQNASSALLHDDAVRADAKTTPPAHPPLEPLLPQDPPAPVLGTGDPEPALPPLQPNPASDAQATAPEEAAPEIVIEIGRIDLKPPPPAQPASPPRAAPARPLPSLGDYLRGKS